MLKQFEKFNIELTRIPMLKKDATFLVFICILSLSYTLCYEGGLTAKSIMGFFISHICNNVYLRRIFTFTIGSGG